MGDLIAVDFNKKRKEFKLEEDKTMKRRVTNQVYLDFKAVLDKVIYLTDNDREYQEHVARVLGGITANLKKRL